MSQKYIKSKNNNSHNAKTYGKYYAKPVYDEKFVETGEKNGKVVQKYVNTKTLVKDVTFEELHENQYSASSNTGGSNTNNSNPSNGGNTNNGGGTGTVTPSGGGNSGSGDNGGDDAGDTN